MHQDKYIKLYIPFLDRKTIFKSWCQFYINHTLSLIWSKLNKMILQWIECLWIKKITILPKWCPTFSEGFSGWGMLKTGLSLSSSKPPLYPPANGIANKAYIVISLWDTTKLSWWLPLLPPFWSPRRQ